MRTFGATFTTEKNKTATPFPFWTAQLTFPAPQGDLYVAGRPSITIGGNAHELVIARWGEYGPATIRDFLRSIDVPAMAMEFAAGPILSDGRRLSDLFGRWLESVRVALYLNFQTAPSTYVQEQMAALIARAPDGYGYLDGALELVSLADKYLDRSVLEEVTEEDHAFARQSHIGLGIPIVIGNVPRVPMRILKGEALSLPLADAANTGTIELDRVEFVPDATAAPSLETWTVTFSSATDYDVESSLDGAQGSGTTAGRFVSSNGRIIIDSSAWSGAAQAGDKITFALDPADVKAVVSESPSGDRVVSIGQLYVNGIPTTDDPVDLDASTDAIDAPVSNASAGSRLVRGGENVTSETGVTNATVQVGENQSIVQPYVIPSDFEEPELIGIEFGVSITGAPGPAFFMLSASSTGNDLFGALMTGPKLLHRLMTEDEMTHGLVETANVPLRAGSTIYLGVSLVVQQGAGNYYSLNTSNVVGGGREVETDVFGTRTPVTGKTITGGLWVRSRRTGDIVALGTLPAGVFMTSIDLTKGRLVRGFKLGLKKEGTPTGSTTVEILKGNGFSPANASVIDVVEYGSTDVTTSYQRVAKRSPQGVVFFPPGRYFLRVTGDDEETFNESTELFERSGYLLRSSASPSPAGSTTFAKPLSALPRIVGVPHPLFPWMGGFTLGVPQESIGPVAPAGASLLRKSLATNGFQTSGGDSIGLDFALDVVPITTSVTENDRATITLEGIEFLPGDLELSCDVNGINRRRPNDAVHFMLGRQGVADADIDLAGSFTAAQTEYVSRGYFFDGVIDTQRTLRDLLIQWQREGRALFDWSSNKAKWFFIPDRASASTVKTLTLSDVVNDGETGPPLVRIRRAPSADIINIVNLRWARDYRRPRSKEAYGRVVKRRSQASIDALDFEGKQDDLLMFDFCRRRPMAVDAADCILERFSYVPRLVEIRTVLTQLELEPTDVIALDFASDALGAAVDGGFGEGGFGPPPGFGGYNQFDGLGGTDPWVIESVRQIADELELEIVAREL